MSDESQWIAPKRLTEEAIEAVERNSHSIKKQGSRIAYSECRAALLDQNRCIDKQLREMLK